MHLAFVKTDKRGATDNLLTAFATRLQQRGIRLAGAVQTNEPCIGSDLCDMDVIVLPDGPTIRISQSLGEHSKGCRLDASALEQASGLVASGLQTHPQLLILNKFGKHEAEGRGFRPLIADALLAGIPVLTAVNGFNEDAFVSFSEGMAECLPSDQTALDAWFERVKTPADIKTAV